MHDYLSRSQKGPQWDETADGAQFAPQLLKNSKRKVKMKMTSHHIRSGWQKHREAHRSAASENSDCSNILYFLMRHEWFWLGVPVPPCHWCLPTPPVNVIACSDLTAAEIRGSLKCVLAQETLIRSLLCPANFISTVSSFAAKLRRRICCCGVTAHKKGFKMLKATTYIIKVSG